EVYVGAAAIALPHPQREWRRRHTLDKSKSRLESSAQARTAMVRAFFLATELSLSLTAEARRRRETMDQNQPRRHRDMEKFGKSWSITIAEEKDVYHAASERWQKRTGEPSASPRLRGEPKGLSDLRDSITPPAA